ncbi:MAG: transcription antitermination factor NusB [Acidimicrobiales bacterium]
MTKSATARGIALACLGRVDEGSYANLAVPDALRRCQLAPPDRHFVTELVYGTTRMRRACDYLVDAHLERPDGVNALARNALRLGAYQLAFLGTPAHAAVSATVQEVPVPTRGLVNAVLRKVAGALPASWPDPGVELSYPDWVLARLDHDIGPERARGALATMNEAAQATERDDGYFQDQASQWVGAFVGAQPGDRVLDVCAAPGGKATAMAGTAWVVAADYRLDRARIVAGNAARLGLDTLASVVGDGRRPPWKQGCFDRVLVDAPCSGLGVLRRRPDARWRVRSEDVGRLATLQRELLDQAAALVRPGGVLVYSVCTLTLSETAGADRWLAEHRGDLVPNDDPGDRPDGPWEPWGRGHLLLPQRAGTDGMYVLKLTRSPG